MPVKPLLIKQITNSSVREGNSNVSFLLYCHHRLLNATTNTAGLQETTQSSTTTLSQISSLKQKELTWASSCVLCLFTPWYKDICSSQHITDSGRFLVNYLVLYNFNSSRNPVFLVFFFNHFQIKEK